MPALHAPRAAFGLNSRILPMLQFQHFMHLVQQDLGLIADRLGANLAASDHHAPGPAHPFGVPQHQSVGMGGRWGREDASGAEEGKDYEMGEYSSTAGGGGGGGGGGEEGWNVGECWGIGQELIEGEEEDDVRSSEGGEGSGQGARRDSGTKSLLRRSSGRERQKWLRHTGRGRLCEKGGGGGGGGSGSGSGSESDDESGRGSGSGSGDESGEEKKNGNNDSALSGESGRSSTTGCGFRQRVLDCMEQGPSSLAPGGLDVKDDGVGGCAPPSSECALGDSARALQAPLRDERVGRSGSKGKEGSGGKQQEWLKKQQLPHALRRSRGRGVCVSSRGSVCMCVHSRGRDVCTFQRKRCVYVPEEEVCMCVRSRRRGVYVCTFQRKRCVYVPEEVCVCVYVPEKEVCVYVCTFQRKRCVYVCTFQRKRCVYVPVEEVCVCVYVSEEEVCVCVYVPEEEVCVRSRGSVCMCVCSRERGVCMCVRSRGRGVCTFRRKRCVCMCERLCLCVFMPVCYFGVVPLGRHTDRPQ